MFQIDIVDFGSKGKTLGTFVIQTDDVPYFEDALRNGAELFKRVRLSLTVDQNHRDFIV